MPGVSPIPKTLDITWSQCSPPTSPCELHVTHMLIPGHLRDSHLCLHKIISAPLPMSWAPGTS